MRVIDLSSGEMDEISSEKIFSSGSTLLDAVLGGGFVLGRVVNLVGIEGSGKTLIALETCANFLQKYPEGLVIYNETEAALDFDYIGSLGIPLDRMIILQDCEHIEEFHDDLVKRISEKDPDVPMLYVLDSLDALSSKEETKAGMDAKYNLTKQKQLSLLFRLRCKDLRKKNCALLIISQLRENVNPMAYERFKRSGGKALDYFATHIIWLSVKAKKTTVVNQVKRVTGIVVGVKCKKNKVAVPHRECEILIRFGYGIDDLVSNVTWLDTTNKPALLNLNLGKQVSGIVKMIRKSEPQQRKEYEEKIKSLVLSEWKQLEAAFQAKEKKYDFGNLQI